MLNTRQVQSRAAEQRHGLGLALAEVARCEFAVRLFALRGVPEQNVGDLVELVLAAAEFSGEIAIDLPRANPMTLPFRDSKGISAMSSTASARSLSHAGIGCSDSACPSVCDRTNQNGL
jgi:hypothetical protein